MTSSLDLAGAGVQLGGRTSADLLRSHRGGLLACSWAGAAVAGAALLGAAVAFRPPQRGEIKS